MDGDEKMEYNRHLFNHTGVCDYCGQKIAFRRMVCDAGVQERLKKPWGTPIDVAMRGTDPEKLREMTANSLARLHEAEDKREADAIRERLRSTGATCRYNGKDMFEMSDRELIAIENRASHRLQEMIDSGKAPRVKSDDTFFSGYTRTGGAQFTNDMSRDHHLAQAKAAGVDVSGKQYFAELAAFPGDPRAWVGSRGEMVKVLEERNWGSDGDVKVKCEPVEPASAKKLAEDLVEDMMFEKMADQFEKTGREQFTRDEVEGMKSEIVETHGSPY